MFADDMVMFVPTRGRPQSIGPMVGAWNDTDADCDLVFAIDEDDPAVDAYLEAFKQSCCVRGYDYVVGPRLRLAGTLNALVRDWAADYDAVGFLGDDHRPRTQNWDRRFAECLSGGTGMVYGNDLLVGEKFPTAVMMTSDIPRTLGYFCPPGMTHLCLDLVWRDWGTGIGRLTYLPDVVIEHVHPAAGKAGLDATYQECNSPAQVEQDSRGYYAYRELLLDDDLDKLRTLIQ